MEFRIRGPIVAAIDGAFEEMSLMRPVSGVTAFAHVRPESVVLRIKPPQPHTKPRRASTKWTPVNSFSTPRSTLLQVRPASSVRKKAPRAPTRYPVSAFTNAPSFKVSSVPEGINCHPAKENRARTITNKSGLHDMGIPFHPCLAHRAKPGMTETGNTKNKQQALKT
jgi:hypothetical protein